MANQPESMAQPGYQIREDYRDRKSAEWYREQYASSLRAKIANWGERRAFLKLLADVPARQTVLDIACGTGRFTGIAVQQGFQVVGSDISTEMLAIARQQIGDHPGLLSLDPGDAEHLPYEADSFDGIVCIRLYQRVPAETRAQMLREVRRVGRGWAILFFGMSSPWLTFRRAVRNKLARRPNVRYPATLPELERELQAAGMTIKKRVWAMPFVSEGLLVLVRW